MKQVLTVTNGVTPVISADTKGKKMVDNVLQPIVGWDAINVTYETAPKLIGEGSYEIASSVGERQLEITINYVGNYWVPFRALQALALAKTELTFTKVITEYAGAEVTTQTLKGKISNLDFPRSYEGWADIKFSVLCKDPTPVTTIS
jgi:hypothetical protein